MTIYYLWGNTRLPTNQTFSLLSREDNLYFISNHMHLVHHFAHHWLFWQNIRSKHFSTNLPDLPLVSNGQSITMTIIMNMTSVNSLQMYISLSYHFLSLSFPIFPYLKSLIVYLKPSYNHIQVSKVKVYNSCLTDLGSDQLTIREWGRFLPVSNTLFLRQNWCNLFFTIWLELYGAFGEWYYFFWVKIGAIFFFSKKPTPWVSTGRCLSIFVCKGSGL